MSLKDDIIDVASYILMVIGLCNIVVSFQIEVMSGYLMGVVGCVAFLLGLKLQIWYSIKKDRGNRKKNR